MPNDPVRILMYSHDTYGLGHITRTLRVARALRDASEHASILILTGSPVAPYMPLPPGADFVKLPSVVKTGPDLYRSRDLEISFRQIKRMRRDLIRGTCETFRPHLFLVDNVPLGMKGEILPSLRYLRKESPATRIILDMRDILDDPQVIEAAWKRDGVRPVLEEFYDRIIILGDPSFYDAQKAYGLPPGKTVHVGYAAPEPRSRRLDGASSDRRARSRTRILVTAGGGGDGVEFLKRVLSRLRSTEGFASEGGASPPHVEIITGPLMDPADRQEICETAGAIHAETHEFVPDMPRRMARADLVIAMAGYNTCCEILSHARAGLLVPRVAPRVEQLLRAQVLREHGLAEVVEPQQMTDGGIGEAIRRALSVKSMIRPDALPRMDGLARLAREVHSLRLTPSGPRSGGLTGFRSHPDSRSHPESPRMAIQGGALPRTEAALPGHGAFWYWPGLHARPQAPPVHRLRRGHP